MFLNCSPISQGPMSKPVCHQLSQINTLLHIDAMIRHRFSPSLNQSNPGLSLILSATRHCQNHSHNAPVPCPIMHHFVTEMCTYVHISVTKWCIKMEHCGIFFWCIVGFVRWFYRVCHPVAIAGTTTLVPSHSYPSHCNSSKDCVSENKIHSISYFQMSCNNLIIILGKCLVVTRMATRVTSCYQKQQYLSQITSILFLRNA